MADIRIAAERLVTFPEMGRNGQVAGTHEWVFRGSPFLMVYEVDVAGDEVRILAVFNGAQDRQDSSE
jgi:toxin ParE1/3/4